MCHGISLEQSEAYCRNGIYIADEVLEYSYLMKMSIFIEYQLWFQDQVSIGADVFMHWSGVVKRQVFVLQKWPGAMTPKYATCFNELTQSWLLSFLHNTENSP